MQDSTLEKLGQAATDRGRPFRILIVDDERYVREVFRDYCALSNAFEIDLALGGTEAIEQIKQSKYDLVTMDLVMPELSGLDALVEIKKVAPQLPVIIITGNATDKLVREAGVMGACRVLYKPVMLEDFLQEIGSALLSTRVYV
ncbi:MAG: response regulator [bacterium]|nr:response regulator [bacterium]